jgi:hypothetical protein
LPKKDIPGVKTAQLSLTHVGDRLTYVGDSWKRQSRIKTFSEALEKIQLFRLLEGCFGKIEENLTRLGRGLEENFVK